MILTYSVHPRSFSTLEMKQDGKVTTRTRLLNEEWNLELSLQQYQRDVTVSFQAADRRSFSLREIWFVNVRNSFGRLLLSEQLHPPTSQSQDLLSHLKKRMQLARRNNLRLILSSPHSHLWWLVWATTWIIGHWQRLVRWLWGSWMYMSGRESRDDKWDVMDGSISSGPP